MKISQLLGIPFHALLFLLVLSVQWLQLISSFQIIHHHHHHHHAVAKTLTSTTSRTTTSTTGLGLHQFNGGYDPGNIEAASTMTKWTPRDAAEFVIWHYDDPNMEDDECCCAMGQQLKPLIAHWEGPELGEFLTRLYLGQKPSSSSSTTSINSMDQDRGDGNVNDDENGDDDEDGFLTVTYDSWNVRNPQWKGGLAAPQGVSALANLLQAALPNSIVEDPIEMARVAEHFLWKEHTWPVVVTSVTVTTELTTKNSRDNTTTTTRTDTSDKTVLLLSKPPRGTDSDSFANVGYTGVLVQIWNDLRAERLGPTAAASSGHSIDDVMEMLPNPRQCQKKRKSWGPRFLQGVRDFFVHMRVQLTTTEKVQLVQKMAAHGGGWTPAKIALMVSTIPEQLPLKQLPTPKQQQRQQRYPPPRFSPHNQNNSKDQNNKISPNMVVLPPPWNDHNNDNNNNNLDISIASATKDENDNDDNDKDNHGKSHHQTRTARSHDDDHHYDEASSASSTSITLDTNGIFKNDNNNKHILGGGGGGGGGVTKQYFTRNGTKPTFSW